MKPGIWIVFGCVSAAVAVSMGAFGAHGLDSWLTTTFPEDAAKRLENWKTAATYQMYHSIGLIMVGLVANLAGRSKLIGASGIMMVLGIVFFSGMLYGWVLADNRIMVMLVPLGGLFFILAWLLLAIAALKLNST